jgi:predicted DNA-binding transcriptional regulator AlpA
LPKLSISQQAIPHRCIIRSSERRKRTGLSDSQTWRLEQVGLHPARVQLSAAAIGWYEDEIDLFVETRPRAGGKRPPLPKARTREPVNSEAAVE